MTFPPDLRAHLDVLDQQQSNLTDALRAMVEGNWQGEPPSLEAYVYAQDPGFQGTLVPRTPIRVSDVPSIPPTFMANFNPSLPMPRQETGWTCSVCAHDWVLRATGVAPDHTRAMGLSEIGGIRRMSTRPTGSWMGPARSCGGSTGRTESRRPRPG
jgi:hypothetical protein